MNNIPENKNLSQEDDRENLCLKVIEAVKFYKEKNHVQYKWYPCGKRSGKGCNFDKDKICDFVAATIAFANLAKDRVFGRLKSYQQTEDFELLFAAEEILCRCDRLEHFYYLYDHNYPYGEGAYCEIPEETY